MTWSTSLPGGIRFLGTFLVPGIAVLAIFGGGFAAGQDVPVRTTPIGAIPSTLPVPQPPPNPTQANSLVESLASSTSLIEVKVGQGRFLTLKENLVIPGKPQPLIAVGDSSVADFFAVGTRQFRVIGKRLGTTDVSITTSDGRVHDFEIQVVADLDVLRAQLRQFFPSASLRVSQFRDKVVVEGQARDSLQVRNIVDTIENYVRAIQRIQISGMIGDTTNQLNPNTPLMPPGNSPAATNLPLQGNVSATGTQQQFTMAPGTFAATQVATGRIQVINLIRVPTSQQVLLKVRVAEMNRTGFREIGGDFLAAIPQFGTLFGSQIGGSSPVTAATVIPNTLSITPSSTFYGTFAHGQFQTVLSALRRNNLLKILAEPNLMALNGHQAEFLAGGSFPVPVQNSVGGSGGTGGISVQFKEFGVRLAFLPIILEDDTIRLTVDPEVSSIDFTLGTTLVPGGTPVPGLNTRKSHTTVELKQGETLAIAGLMQISLSGQTQRIPGLGDLPYIGAFFSNTTDSRIEKELVVLVTPYLAEPMTPGQVPPGPGDEVKEPNDLEFFFMNRIEGRTGIDARSSSMYDDPLHLVRPALLERKYLIGPSGYSR
jgi:pilus assembly protein CpaC